MFMINCEVYFVKFLFRLKQITSAVWVKHSPVECFLLHSTKEWYAIVELHSTKEWYAIVELHRKTQFL
jgi:hypothetical protein